MTNDLIAQARKKYLAEHPLVIGPEHPVDGGPVVMGDPSGMDLGRMFDVIDAGRGEVTK